MERAVALLSGLDERHAALPALAVDQECGGLRTDRIAGSGQVGRLVAGSGRLLVSRSDRLACPHGVRWSAPLLVVAVTARGRSGITHCKVLRPAAHFTLSGLWPIGMIVGPSTRVSLSESLCGGRCVEALGLEISQRSAPCALRSIARAHLRERGCCPALGVSRGLGTAD